MTLKQLAGKLSESHCMESLETPGKLEVRANFRSKTAHLQAIEISITKLVGQAKVMSSMNVEKSWIVTKLSGGERLSSGNDITYTCTSVTLHKVLRKKENFFFKSGAVIRHYQAQLYADADLRENKGCKMTQLPVYYWHTAAF